MPKLRVGVIYGGRSGEHEVSIVSASSIFKHLDPGRYVPVPIRIEKDGRWVLPDTPPAVANAADVTKLGPYSTDNAPAIEPTAAIRGLDVIFPVLHGPYGEDGTVQGALETLKIPYTGSGVMASALAMDKWRTKLVWLASGIPTPRYRMVDAGTDWMRVVAGLGLQLIVKPSREGG